MKNCKNGIVIGVLILILLNFTLEARGQKIKIDSPILKAVLLSRQARADGDVETDWKYVDSLTKKEKFGNDFENFKKFAEKVRTKITAATKSELKDVKLI